MMPTPSITDIPAIILAGGLGTRLRSVVADRPKVMAQVGGRPFLTYLLDQLEVAGWRNIILCVGHLGEQIQPEIGSTYHSLSIAYSVEAEPLGTAGAIRLAFSQTQSDLCLAMNGDSYINADLRAFREWHLERSRAGSLLLVEVQDAARFGTVEVGENQAIRGFQEKQGLAVPGWINGGIYLLAHRLLESIPAGRAVSIERDCFPQWTREGLGGFAVQAEFIDIGTPESFERAETFFKQIEVPRSYLNGRAIISSSMTTILDQRLMTNSSLNANADARAKIQQHFAGSISVKQRVMTECADDILAAAALVTNCLERKSKLLLCGNGGSAADCQHIAGEFVSVLTQDFMRPGLPAIALTTDTSILTASANDFGFAGVFERQVQALGQPGDTVIGISTSGNSENVVRALHYAKAQGMQTLALTGGTGGKMAEIADVSIRIPSDHVQHIQESHIAVGHILCHLVERALFAQPLG